MPKIFGGVSNLIKKHNVIFLIDNTPPSRLMMLKRAEWKAFAPNMYTGIGGKIEAGESPRDGALRELKEETGLEGLTLVEIARCKIDRSQVLHYYFAEYQDQVPACNEGDLAWVDLEDVFDLDIIPTTKAVMKEWARRGFDTTPSWTVFSSKMGERDGMALIVVDKVEIGLY